MCSGQGGPKTRGFFVSESSPNKLRHIRSQNGQNVERLVVKRRRKKVWRIQRCFAFLEPTVSVILYYGV